MDARRIAESIHWVGAVDWDRRLFDDLIPLPDGTTYNAYLVQGAEKTALLDAVDPAMLDKLLARLSSAGVQKIDYVVSHHTEQDHSGGIPCILAQYPEAQVLASDKARGLLMDHLGLPADRLRVVQNGEKVDLGGLTLEFIYFPWVHWPETMLTWVPERRVLFTCDLFGSHLATSDVLAHGDPQVLPAAKRYYAEIMMPFRNFIERNWARVTALDPAVIAPSHGPVYDEPRLILDAYQEWVFGPPKNLVLLPYISMHGSTRILVEHLVDACARRGVRIEQMNLVDTDVGRLAMLLVDAATIVLGTPTILNGPHPNVAYVALLANLLKPKARYLSVIGSLGWAGKTVEQLGAMVSSLKLEMLPTVLCKGLPKPADLEAIEQLAQTIAEKHAGL
ncbi:MAG TPA: FprA family A-type flavoprotein [Verrucomicrobiota bacterium]|nr:FprA family A-type flavoprotein [Verrucomicrobiota bacterium]HNU52392.1 FprA family A-type flavoprotein [Verrucomicrobiota bacterium]